MNVAGILVSSMWSSNLSLQTILYALLISKECQYGALHWVLLKTIFYCLNYSSNLILTAPTFMKTRLVSTEQVIGFCDIVKTISKNAFQKFDNIWSETDGMEKCNFTRRFLSF